ncbi:MAG: DUF1501 domain-containing protein [Myxococcales bacterium]|nr:DUF1501 domain-containing protein [Myxococcales bacterium]
MTRRGLGLFGLSALAAVASSRFGHAEETASGERGMSLIVLWLQGGPSQLETFDPKPGLPIGGPTRAIPTSVSGLSIAHHLPQIAEQMRHLALIRSVVGEEGDHERASILLKTGRRPEVALTHPSLGAVAAEELPGGDLEIPRYVSILGRDRASRGGFLGQRYDPFVIGDPQYPIQDVIAPVAAERQARRLDALAALERGFGERHPGVAEHTLHPERTAQAVRTMTSPQLAAFALDDEPSELRRAYGDNPFGRGCLVARRLVEVGVRCVEVTLRGWDSHIDNHGVHARLVRALDPALASLVEDLRERDTLRHTAVLCVGEFGRTPRLNRFEGRDHWPHGFSVAIAGGGVRGGQVIGSTDPEGGREVKDPRTISDVYATVLTGLGIDPELELVTPAARPIRLSEGAVIGELLER